MRLLTFDFQQCFSSIFLLLYRSVKVSRLKGATELNCSYDLHFKLKFVTNAEAGIKNLALLKYMSNPEPLDL
jgi:hypothetical protein